MEFGLDEMVAMGELRGDSGTVLVRSGDTDLNVARSRGKNIPESRDHSLRLSRQGYVVCPRAYDGCSAMLLVGNMGGVCSQGNYHECDVFNGRGGMR